VREKVPDFYPTPTITRKGLLPFPSFDCVFLEVGFQSYLIKHFSLFRAWDECRSDCAPSAGEVSIPSLPSWISDLPLSHFFQFSRFGPV